MEELEPLFDMPPLPPMLTESFDIPIGFIDLSPYYLIPQITVAEMLNMRVSTLSRRWRLASNGTKYWPYRQVKIIDEMIGKGRGNAEQLMRRRRQLLRPVIIKR